MDDPQATRESLLARLGDGQDKQAWSDFVDLYSQVVYGFARRRGLQGIRSDALSPDGRYLTVATDAGSLLLWDTATHQLAGRLLKEGSAVSAMAFTSDGLLLSGNRDGMLEVWNPNASERIYSFRATPGEISDIALSPDGRLLATVTASDNAITLWNTDSWRVNLTLREYTSAATALAFSPDGQMLASASSDSKVRLRQPGDYRQGWKSTPVGCGRTTQAHRGRKWGC